MCFLATDADDNGGKLILTAGAPTITGNDEERMLLALRQIADKERAIPIRIGVNRGSVFAGDIGPWYRRTYTVMGDAVNLSARLMAKATAGQIFATADVIDASGTLFATTELEPFMVKGKAKPVQAWAVGEVLGSRTRDAHVELPLIGRDKELAELRAALEDARGGRGSLVEIVGEPGIGKSRLIEELHAEQEADVLFANAEAFTSSTPYVVWRGILREMLELPWEAEDAVVIRRLQEVVVAADPSLVQWLPLIAIPLDVDMPMTAQVEQLAEEFRQPKLFDVVSRFLKATLRKEVLIHVEDAHLLDGASAELFAYLVREMGDRPWLFTLARRDDATGFVAPDHECASTIHLGPLPRDHTVELVEAATESAPLLPHNVALVADRSGGNPQFALDLAQVVATGGMLPESIETAAMARIDALAPADRSLVRRASVLGVSFARRFLEEVLEEGSPDPDETTWERLSEFFADEGDGYTRFRRAVVRDAAYTGLPFRTRRQLHARVAARFEAEFNPEETGGLLSLHYFLSGTHDKAWTYARLAAKRAGEQFANTESAQLYQRAVDAGKQLADLDPRELGVAYESLGIAWMRSSEYLRASAAFAAAARLLKSDRIGRARVTLRRAYIEENLGAYSKALRWTAIGLAALEGVESYEARSQRARLLQFRSTLLLAQGNARRAVGWAEAAAEEARVAEDEDALAQAFDSLDWANMSLGRPTGEHWRRALAIYEKTGDVNGESGILLNLGAGLFYDGRWEEALDSFERARQGRLAVGDPVMATLAADNAAEILCERGQFEDAEAILRDSVRVWRASANLYMLGNCLEYLARVTARTGRVEDALGLLAEARQAFVDVGARDDVLRTDAREAECRLLLGDADRALEVVTEALERASAGEDSGMMIPMLTRSEGYALAQRGALADARRAFEKSLEVARSRRDDYEEAITLIALGRLARLEGVDDPVEWHVADDVLQRLEVRAVPVFRVTTA